MWIQHQGSNFESIQFWRKASSHIETSPVKKAFENEKMEKCPYVNLSENA